MIHIISLRIWVSRSFKEISHGNVTTYLPRQDVNKEKLCDYLIDKGEFASQKLLKLAVSYRFAFDHYSGNPNVNNGDCEEKANNEEVRLIREIVNCIVQEYNELRK